MKTTKTAITTDASDTTADRAARRRSPRRAARFAAVALAAGSVVGAFAGPALAESPPAPPPGPQIGVPPPGPIVDLNHDVGENQHKILSTTANTGDNYADLSFIANTPNVIVQTSTTKPYMKDGHLTVGPVSPQPLQGMHVGPEGAKTWWFHFSRDGLTPGTTYYNLFNINGIAGQEPNRSTQTFKTKNRYVRSTPLSVHVTSDADSGAKGAGDLQFGFRKAPEANPLAPTFWNRWTGKMYIDSGETRDLSGLNLGETFSTKANSAIFQVQGEENDVQSYDNCAIEGGEVAPMQYSDACYDMAFAQGTAQLPTSRYQGAHKQVIKAVVTHTPALRFEVDILVETWAAD